MGSPLLRQIHKAVLICASIMAGCADADDIARPEHALFGTPKPVSCPTNATSSTTATIGPLGGLLSLDGTSVSIPAGAVLGPTTITLKVPASRYLEIDLTANEQEHFVFEAPLVVTIDYSRCTRANIGFAPLSVWYWDSATGVFFENMLGIDNKLLQTITFITPHFSGYVMAN